MKYSFAMTFFRNSGIKKKRPWRGYVLVIQDCDVPTCDTSLRPYQSFSLIISSLYFCALAFGKVCPFFVLRNIDICTGKF